LKPAQLAAMLRGELPFPRLINRGPIEATRKQLLIEAEV